MKQNKIFRNSILNMFDMTYPEYFVLGVVGKPRTVPITTLNLLIDVCISSGGKVFLSTLENSTLTESDNLIIKKGENVITTILDNVEYAIDSKYDVQLVAIDCIDLRNFDVLDLKRFAKNHKCHIIVTTSGPYHPDNFDGYIYTDN